MPYPELITLLRNALRMINTKTQALEAKWVAEATRQAYRSESPRLTMPPPMQKTAYPKRMSDKPDQERRNLRVMADSTLPRSSSKPEVQVGSPTLNPPVERIGSASPSPTGRISLTRPAFGLRAKQPADLQSAPATNPAVTAIPPPAANTNTYVPKLFFADVSAEARSPSPKPIPQLFFAASTPTPSHTTIDPSASPLSPKLPNGSDAKKMMFRAPEFVVLPKKIQRK